MNGATAARIRKIVAAVSIAGMLAAGIGITIILLTHRDSGVDPAARPAAVAPPAPSMPTPEEFVVAVDVTEHHCDGAACRYVYSIQPHYRGMHPLPDHAFTVSYEITGGHQPQPGTFTVSNGEARMLQGVTVEGPPNATLQATVTEVAAVEGPVQKSPEKTPN